MYVVRLCDTSWSALPSGEEFMGEACLVVWYDSSRDFVGTAVAVLLFKGKPHECHGVEPI